MTYNLHEIMCKAWKLFRKGIGTFAECLHRHGTAQRLNPSTPSALQKPSRPPGLKKNAGLGQTGRSRGVKSCTAQEPLSKSS